MGFVLVSGGRPGDATPWTTCSPKYSQRTAYGAMRSFILYGFWYAQRLSVRAAQIAEAELLWESHPRSTEEVFRDLIIETIDTRIELIEVQN